MAFMFAEFTKYPNLKHGFSSRVDGSMNRHLAKENRNSYFRKIAIDPLRVVTPDLVHGVHVEKITNEGEAYIPNTDGLITNKKDVYLSSTGADCFVVYFFDPITRSIGITHAGWRGLLAGVVKNTVTALGENFSAAPENLLIGIGPSIHVCHFEISAADKIKFQEYPDCIFEREGKVFVDLSGIITSQLLSEGVQEKNIDDCGLCTYCNEQDFFSYRRDKPKDIQSMIGYIGLS